MLERYEAVKVERPVYSQVLSEKPTAHSKEDSEKNRLGGMGISKKFAHENRVSFKNKIKTTTHAFTKNCKHIIGDDAGAHSELHRCRDKWRCAMTKWAARNVYYTSKG